MSWCVLVRDLRYPCGGFETWVEELAATLPSRGVPSVALLVSEEETVPDSYELMATRVIAVKAHEDDVAQAAAILAALQRLAAEGLHGVFLSGGYPYLDIASINLAEAPWVRVPVLHGRDPGAYDSMCMGPPRALVAPASDLAEALRKHLRARVGRLRALGRVVFISNGVPIPPQRTTQRAASNSFAIAVITRLNLDVKRPLDYLHIAALLVRKGMQFRMTIMGDGPAKPQMLALRAQLQLSEHVELAGVLTRDQVYERLARSDVLVHASESEACGLAVAEALACGCPVVAADSGGEMSIMVNDATGIRVPIGDHAGFADALMALRNEAARRHSLGAAGRRLAEKRYSLEAMSLSYARLVRRVGDTGPRPAWKPPRDLAKSAGEALSRRRRNPVLAWVAQTLRRGRVL